MKATLSQHSLFTEANKAVSISQDVAGSFDKASEIRNTQKILDSIRNGSDVQKLQTHDEVLKLPGRTGGKEVDLNKLNHIFGQPKHNLNDFLVKFGNDKEQAFNAIVNSSQTQILKKGIEGRFIGEKVIVNGSEITVNGTVINGTVMIGTAYIP